MRENPPHKIHNRILKSPDPRCHGTITLMCKMTIVEYKMLHFRVFVWLQRKSFFISASLTVKCGCTCENVQTTLVSVIYEFTH